MVTYFYIVHDPGGLISIRNHLVIIIISVYLRYSDYVGQEKVKFYSNKDDYNDPIIDHKVEV